MHCAPSIKGEMIVKCDLAAVGGGDPRAVGQEFDVHLPSAIVVVCDEERHHDAPVVCGIAHARYFQPRLVVAVPVFRQSLDLGAVE